MHFDYEECRANLEKLQTWYKENKKRRNEAATRLQLIDKLFFDCLGWSKDDDVLPEEPYNQEYSDYTFLAPRSVLIVEAKKEGDYFELPAGKEKLEYALPTLTKDYPNLKKALLQVAGYCQSRGVPYGAVSNGHQIVAFIATRSDGMPPLEGKALVFHSIQFMYENFLHLWQALSKPGVEAKKLQSRLIGRTLPELPPKLSTSIYGYPGVKSRNIFQTDLQNVSELVIEDIIRSSELESEFFKECYVQSSQLSHYALVSKNILQTRYATLFDSGVPGPTLAPVLKSGKISPELVAESFSRRPILLIGDVGVGKTTFIRRLVSVDAANIFDLSFVFHINLGSQGTFDTDLGQFIPNEIIRQLNESYGINVDDKNFIRRLYTKELVDFKSGIYAEFIELDPVLFKRKEIEYLEKKLADKSQYLKDILQYLARSNKRQVIIFIDNSDQRSDDIQQQAFLIAQEIAESWRPVTVFVALRPETFYRSMRIGALSGYHPKAFTISPPIAKEVIVKRLNFAIKIAQGLVPVQTLENIHIRFESLEKLINVFLKSLSANSANNAIGEFIDNISGGNIRLALDFVRSFFGTGHVDTKKIIDIYDESGSYIIPYHEFLGAVIYGDSEYYDSDQSPVANLFDISTLDRKEHFLVPLIIGLLASYGASSIEEGFIETTSIYEHMQHFGFTPEQIDIALVLAVRKKLIETSARRMPQPGQFMPQSLRVTTIGMYHTVKLCHSFSYMDAITVDTPILDQKVRAELQVSHDVQIRLSNVDILREYLNVCWTAFDSSSKASSMFDWRRISTALKKNTDDIRGRVNSPSKKGKKRR